ncbi:MAG: DUF1232 domain-containing protein [Deltaproteobacteria bacterium]|nr:DUF1232 domain-containing protein [Deltaproteobacteria bacterium]MBI2540780.1 DUF1232 domain-containing protein [Deltaproteobacteria bacterium]
MGRLEIWKRRADELKREIHAIYLAYKDPRVPWHAKLLAACVVAYAFSPIDLIPDFIPILGYLDDLILVPVGVYFVLKMIPDDVMADCRKKARALSDQRRPRNLLAATIIIAIWVLLALLSVHLLLGLLRD